MGIGVVEMDSPPEPEAADAEGHRVLDVQLYKEYVVRSIFNRACLGLVTRVGGDSSDSDSSDEDRLDSSDENGHDRTLAEGFARIRWIDSAESVVKVTDLEVVDKPFMHGEVVALASDCLGQTGTVIDVEISVDLELSNKAILKDIDSKQLRRVRALEPGDNVIRGHYLGRVEKIPDKDDGTVIVDWTFPAVEVSYPSTKQDTRDLVPMTYFLYTKWVIGDPVLVPQGLRDLGGELEGMLDVGSEATVVNTRTSVDILWQDGKKSQKVGSCSLVLGEQGFMPEQFVQEQGHDDNEGHREGVLKSVDSKRGSAVVRWLKPLSPLEKLPEFDEEETVRVDELKEHPNYCYDFEDIVLRLPPAPCGESETEVVKSKESSGEDVGRHEVDASDNEKECPSKVQTQRKRTERYSGETLDLSSLGMIIGLQDGAIEVCWANGTVSKVGPQAVLVVSRDYMSSGASRDAAILQWLGKCRIPSEYLRLGKEGVADYVKKHTHQLLAALISVPDEDLHQLLLQVDPGRDELDLFLLQCCSVISPDCEGFVEWILGRFSLSDYFNLSLWQSDESQVTRAQELLILLIRLVSERRFCGLTEKEALRRELVQRLAVGDMTRSDLLQALPPRLQRSKYFEDCLEDVGGSSLNGTYYLIRDCWRELDLYYPRWSPRELQSAEERYLKAGWSGPAVYLQLPRWSQPCAALQDLRRLITTSRIHDMLRSIFYQAAYTENPSTMEKLLLHALHLLALALAVCKYQLNSSSNNVEDHPPLVLRCVERVAVGRVDATTMPEPHSMLSLLVLLLRKQGSDSVDGVGSLHLGNLIKKLLRSFAELDSGSMHEIELLAGWKTIVEIPISKLEDEGNIFDLHPFATPCRFRFFDAEAYVHSRTLRLFETSLLLFKYAAISYPWKGLSLSPDTPGGSFLVAGAKSGGLVSIDTLSTTCKAALQDDCKLLWFDRMCILQQEQDHEDKSSQCTEKRKKIKEDKGWQIHRMCDVYKECEVCLALLGGVQRLARLDEETTWARRAWTLQEALVPPLTRCLFRWTKGAVRGCLNSVANIIEVEEGHSATADIKAVLGWVMRKKVAYYLPENEVMMKDTVRIIHEGEASALKCAVYDVDTKAREVAIWRCSFMRTSSRPVDMVFSIMGLFGVTLDTSQFSGGERKKATIALTQEIMKKGGKANWLGLAYGMSPAKFMSTMPAFPETTEQGDVIVTTNKGQENMRDILDFTWWLEDAPSGRVDDQGYLWFFGKGGPIRQVSFQGCIRDCRQEYILAGRFENQTGNESERVWKALPLIEGATATTYAVVVGRQTGFRHAECGCPFMPKDEDVVVMIVEKINDSHYFQRVAFAIVTVNMVRNWQEMEFSVGGPEELEQLCTN